MFSQKKYVCLADIESVRIPYSTFAKALNELSNYGEIAACKFYGYSAKRSKDYNEFISENNFDALSVLPKKKRGRLDLRQVIDAVRLARFPNIDGFFLIYGNGDIKPLIAYLKSYGMDVIAGCIEPDKNAELCNKVILLNKEELVIKDVLKKGYKQVEPASLVYIDSESEEIQDSKIEEVLNRVVPEVKEEELKEEMTVEEAEAETEEKLESLMTEIENDVKQAEEESKLKEDEYAPSPTEALSDVKAPVEEKKVEEEMQEEEEELIDHGPITQDDTSKGEEMKFKDIEDDDDERETVSLEDEESVEVTKKDEIDDDALIAQLYKLLGNID